MELYQILEQCRKRVPVVQCITNFVTVNDCANLLLAAGASPTMAMDVGEAEETVEGVQALVCNLGAIEHAPSMLLAGKRANERGIPVIFDPVVAGRSRLRIGWTAKMLKEIRFTVIRGNASEIRAIAGQSHGDNGVDVSCLDAVTEENLFSSADMVRKLAKDLGTVIAMTGTIDVISDGAQTAILRNGCATMSRITGSGCMLTALTGGLCGAVPNEPFRAACAAAAIMGISGEVAEELRLEKGAGNATFRNDLIDCVYQLTEKTLKERISYEIYKG